MNDGVTLMIVHDEKMSINNSISFLLESYIECGKYMEEWDVSRNAIGEYPMFVEKWIWCTYYVCFPAMCICVLCTFTYKSEQTIFTTQTIFPFLLLFCIDQTNLFICNHLSQKCCRVVIRICSVILSINSGQWACYRVLYVYILVFTFFPYCFSKERYWICLRCFFLQLNRLNTQHPSAHSKHSQHWIGTDNPTWNMKLVLFWNSMFDYPHANSKHPYSSFTPPAANAMWILQYQPIGSVLCNMNRQTKGSSVQSISMEQILLPSRPIH